MRMTGMIRKQWFKCKLFVSRYGLVLVVTLLIVISIALFFSLWYSVSNPGNLTERRNKQEAAKKIVASKPIQAVYDTDRIIINQNNEQKVAVDYHGSTNEVTEKIYDWPLYKARRKRYSKSDYLAQLKRNDYAVLFYPDTVTGDIVSHDFKSDIGLKSSNHIDRIMVPLNGKGSVFFGDDKNHQFYEATLSDGAKPLNIDWGKHRVKANVFWKNDQVQLELEESITLPERNYLLDENKVTDISKNVFTQTGDAPKAVTRGDDTIYSDTSSRQLVANNKTGRMTLEAYDDNREDDTLSDRFNAGYHWLSSRTNLPENLYYFEQSKNGNQVQYRYYSDGLPIFNVNQSGLVQIDFKADDQIKIDFSKYVLQVPLPKHKDSEVTLPDEKTVRQNIMSQNLGDVQDLRVGYEWVDSDDSEFITLVPKWFVKIKNDWHPVNDDFTVSQAGDVK